MRCVNLQGTKKLINLLFHLKFFTRFTNVLDKISFKTMQK